MSLNYILTKQSSSQYTLSHETDIFIEIIEMISVLRKRQRCVWEDFKFQYLDKGALFCMQGN